MPEQIDTPAPAVAAGQDPANGAAWLYRGEDWSERPADVPEAVWDKAAGGIDVRKTLKRLADTQREFHALRDQTRAPKEYGYAPPETLAAVLPDTPDGSPILAAFTRSAHDLGLTQKQYDGIIGTVGELLVGRAVADHEIGVLAEAWNKPGEAVRQELAALTGRADRLAAALPLPKALADPPRVKAELERWTETALGVELFRLALAGEMTRAAGADRAVPAAGAGSAGAAAPTMQDLVALKMTPEYRRRDPAALRRADEMVARLAAAEGGGQ